MLHNANIISRKNVLFKRDSAVEVKHQIFLPGSFRIKVKSELCIKTKHIGQKLQIILIPDVIQRLILGIRDNTIVRHFADEIGIYKTDIAAEQPLSTRTSLIHGMVEGIANECTDILLPEPRPIKQDTKNLLCPSTNLMLLIMQNQQA